MARKNCLAGIDDANISLIRHVLRAAGALASPKVARPFSVSELRGIAPDLLLCDVDASEVDKLELLRRIRFALPDCMIVVYTGVTKRTWAVACHLAGANGMLSKESSQAELTTGLRDALQTGCFTDPRFAAA
jgi:DNA-binding NarL/FixJ family response regulator